MLGSSCWYAPYTRRATCPHTAWARAMSTVPRGAARAPHISLTYPGIPARPAGSAASHNDPEPVLAAGFERGAARAGAILAVPSARMERRARGRCAAVRPCCRRLATGCASHAGWHTLCRRSCCRAAEGGRERRTRRGRSSAALGRPNRASAGRPRRACRPRRRLLGAGSGASGPRTKHIQVKAKVRGVCAACSAALR